VPLVFSPNGQHIILVGRPTTLLVDPLTGKVARKFDAESGHAFFMADNRTVVLKGWFTFSSDGKQQAAVKGGNIRVWDPGNASRVLKKELRLPVRTAKDEHVVLAFSRSGRYLGAAAPTGSLYVFDLAADKLLFNQPSAAHGLPICLLSFSPNGKTLVNHAQQLPSARVWEV